MKGWVNNLISYKESNNVGKCPYCNSDRVKVEEHKGKIRDSITFFCEECKKTEHFDGITKD